MFTKEDLPQLVELETYLMNTINNLEVLHKQVTLTIDTVTAGCTVTKIPVTSPPKKMIEWTNLIRTRNNKLIKWRNIP
jgi:hypothetical protein